MIDPSFPPMSLRALDDLARTFKCSPTEVMAALVRIAARMSNPSRVLDETTLEDIRLELEAAGD